MLGKVIGTKGYLYVNGLWLGAFLAGVLGALQGVVFGRTVKAGGLLLATAILSFVQGLAPFVLWWLDSKSGLPLDWRWPLVGGTIGGVMGIAILGLNSTVLNQLGAGTTFVLVTAGLMTASLLLDHMGWSGVTRSALDPARLAGVCLVFVGAWLVSRTR
jgi:transporter family-2 protein